MNTPTNDPRRPTTTGRETGDVRARREPNGWVISIRGEDRLSVPAPQPEPVRLDRNDRVILVMPDN